MSKAKVKTQQVFVTTDEMEFTSEESANVHQEIVDLRKEMNRSKARLRKALSECTHPDSVLVNTVMATRSTDIEDEFGDFRYTNVERHEYVCRCCNATAYKWVDQDTIYWSTAWI